MRLVRASAGMPGVLNSRKIFGRDIAASPAETTPPTTLLGSFIERLFEQGYRQSSTSKIARS